MVEDSQRVIGVAGPDEVAALRAEADRLLRAGAIEPAIAAHERLLAARPDLADSWFNLGWLRRAARRFEPALEAYDRAIATGVRGPEEAQLNRAAILSEHLDRAEEAEAELARAIAANPNFVLARLNLGQLHEDRGDPAAARRAYDGALALDPLNARALARLAALDVFEVRAGDAIDRARIAMAQADERDRAEIGFALGNALDSAGDYDEAFAVFTDANRRVRASLPAGRRYDRAAAEALINALIAMGAPAAAEPAGKEPIFICGLFRSGSTLAEQILARHLQVTAGGELEALPALVLERLQPYPQALAAATPALTAELRDRYLGEVRALHPQARRLTDKRPDNFLHIGLIKAMFPDARIVHTRRDPLDNALSIFFLHFEESVAYGFALEDIAHWHRQYARLMQHWRALHPAAIFDLDYDKLVAAPRPEIEALLGFLGLPWEAACLAASPAATTVRTASVWQVRQPLHARSSGRWRHYERHIGPLIEALGT